MGEVKIDGGIHDKRKEQDKLRDEVIEYLGIEVVRISNIEVLENIDKVMERLIDAL